VISRELRRIFNCDFVGLALPESSGKYLRQHMIDFPESKGLFKEGSLYPIQGSLSGIAFRDIKPVLVDQLAGGVAVWTKDKDFYKRVLDEGPFRSGCFVPLLRKDMGVLGVLQLTSRKEHSFTGQDLQFLEQVASQIAITVANALEYKEINETKERLAEQTLYLEEEIRVEHNFEEVVGNSSKLKEVLEGIEIVAPTDSTVLVLGETGTGKELVARAIHNRSSRRGQPFVKINCAAIPSGLLESELFGHEKGAFTGAIAQKIGRFELAHKGTLFLDEVGDIPLELQPKLLRVLQEQEFERLGSTRTQRVDVRLLAATNSNLTQMVAEKKFRSDLYYRLNVFPVKVPPLRERREDIPLLVRHFANKYSRRVGKRIRTIPKEVMDTLTMYSWPGNIRELQNLMERAVLLSSGPILRVPVAELLAESDREREQDGNVLEQAERELIVKALRETNWVVGGPRGAAVRLGLSRTTLAYKMQRLDISRSRQ
jgi:formate hydrogenlyase transcriptional activator